MIDGKREDIPSFEDPKIGGPRRLKLLSPPAHLSGTAITMSSKTGKTSTIENLKEVHDKTHAPFRDIQMLLERTGNRNLSLSVN